VIADGLDNGCEVFLVVAYSREEWHHAGTGENAGRSDLFHRCQALFGGRSQAFDVLQGFRIRRVLRIDNAKGYDGAGALLNSFEDVQVFQDQGGTFQHQNRKAQVETDLQHLSGETVDPLYGLVVAGHDRVYRGFTQGAPQQIGGVFLGADEPIKVRGVVVRRKFLLAAVAESAAVLAAGVGMSAVAGPKPVIRPFGPIEDRLGAVAEEGYPSVRHYNFAFEKANRKAVNQAFIFYFDLLEPRETILRK